MQIERKLRISAPAERVWALIDDDRNHPKWMPNVIGTRYPDGRPRGDPVGTRFVQRMNENGKVSEYEGQVTAYEPGRMLAVRLTPEAFAITVCYVVDGDEDWTLLQYACQLRARSVKGWLMMHLGKRMLQSILEQQLVRLKIVAETGTVPD
jgi:uncharacterized protein YndB with AHSA1/START domain